MSREDIPDAQPRGAKDPRLGRTHDRILDAYAEVLAGTPADRALRAVFKKARDLGANERAYVSDVVYDLVRAQRAIDDRLDRALKAEGKKRDLLDAPIVTRLRLLTYLALNGATVAELAARDAYAVKRIPKLFERIVSGKLPPVKRSPAEELAVAVSLPDWIAARLYDRFGAERAEAIGRALLSRAPLTLRVNTLRGTREEIAQKLGVEHEPTKLSPFGLILPEHVDLSSWPELESGAIEVQDEGSQLLALATGAAPKETILDACAGAGGKTLALAAMMGNTGRLIALDPDPKKLEELKKRARRAGVTNMEPIAGQVEALPEKLRGTFDRALVDAPCTGTGAFRRHPDARWRAEERELAAQVERQRRLIAGVVNALKPGGLIVYATCSVLAEENEDVVAEALKTDPRIDAVPLSSTLGELAKTLGAGGGAWSARIGPGPSDRDPDGFFVALMKKRM